MRKYRVWLDRRHNSMSLLIVDPEVQGVESYLQTQGYEVANEFEAEGPIEARLRLADWIIRSYDSSGEFMQQLQAEQADETDD